MKIVIILSALLGSIVCYSQLVDDQISRGLSFTLFKEQITLPFQKTNAIQNHWGGTLAYEIAKKRQGSYQFTHVFQGGYYYHRDINQVAFIAWKPKFELRFNDTFNIHAILGIGYAHSFLIQSSYKYENGVYVEKKDWGTPHFMPSIGFGLGFNLERIITIPVEAFFRYEAFSLAPYKPKGTLPFTTNTMLSLGLKYSFN